MWDLDCGLKGCFLVFRKSFSYDSFGFGFGFGGRGRGHIVERSAEFDINFIGSKLGVTLFHLSFVFVEQRSYSDTIFALFCIETVL